MNSIRAPSSGQAISFQPSVLSFVINEASIRFTSAVFSESLRNPAHLRSPDRVPAAGGIQARHLNPSLFEGNGRNRNLPARSLRDVGSNGSRSSSHLAREPIDLILWKSRTASTQIDGE